MASSVLQLVNVSFSYNDQPIIKHVNLDIFSGSINVILGCNGAGKSVLAKLIAGALTTQSGNICIDNVSIGRNANDWPVHYCPQELSIFGELSVIDNLLINNQITRTPLKLIDHGRSYARAKEILSKLGINCDPKMKARYLSRAQKYLLQFGRVLVSKPRFIILDEICATFSHTEIATVHSIIQELKEQGIGIIYITHKLQEIKDIADTIMVLKDGQIVEQCDPSTADIEKLTYLMFGEERCQRYPKLPVAIGSPLLEVSHISNNILHDISFCLHEGEIIGIAGIAGSGRTQLLRSLVGLEPIKFGDIIYAESETKNRRKSPVYVGYLPEDRDRQSLFFNLNIVQNITIRNIMQSSSPMSINHGYERYIGSDLVERLEIRGASPNGLVRELSSGNRQKVVVAQCIYKKCKVYLFDEPTHGIDIAGKIEIYNIMNELVRNGAGIILVSSDFSELVGMSDSILVMKEGFIVAVLSHQDVNNDNDKLFKFFL